MALYALENLDDALDVTREFFGDLGRTAWLKLAVVAFFVGGAGASFPGFNVPSSGGGQPGTGGPTTGELPPFEPDAGFWTLVAAVVVVAVLLALLFALVGAVMEFVFVQSLRTGDVSVREYWGRYWRKGLRLLGFRLVVGLLALVGFGLGALVFAFPFLTGADVGLSLLAALVLIPVFVVLAILVGLVNGFTTMFVVPIMILEDCGVLAGWRRLWPTVTAQWTQYLAYAVGAFILSLAGGIVVAIGTAVLAIALLIPFGVLFAVGAALLAVAEPVGIAVLVLTGLLFGLAVLLATALVQAPVKAYLRYYALLVLGDVDADLDVVPDRRRAVRELLDEE